METEDMLWIGGLLFVAWYLYQNGLVGATTTSATTTATLPASVSLSGPVTFNQGANSFAANVVINGTPSLITVGDNTGIATDQYGNNITPTLQAEGVSIPGLLQMMESAYSAQQNPVAASAPQSIPTISTV